MQLTGSAVALQQLLRGYAGLAHGLRHRLMQWMSMR